MYMSMNTQYCQDVRSSQLDLYIQCNPNQNPSKLVHDIDELILKFIWREKKAQNRIYNIEEEEQSWMTLTTQLQVCYEPKLIKTVCFGERTDKAISGTDQRVQK